MTENELFDKSRIEAARDYLSGYRLCMDMLHLHRYERKRAKPFEELCRCEDVLMGNEAYWRARMFEAENLIGSMKNGREKLILYYHYIKGESIERAADLLGISRRTGYRAHQRGLLVIGIKLDRIKREREQDLGNEMGK